MPWNTQLPDAQYFTPESPQLEALVNEVLDQDVVAIDTETTGLKIWKDLPLFWSLAWGKQRRVCMPINTLFAFEDCFRDPTKRWVFANAKFDMHMLANVGVEFAGDCVDTAVMHALLYEEESHALKDMASKVLGWRWTDFFDTFRPLMVPDNTKEPKLLKNKTFSQPTRKESIKEMLLRIAQTNLPLLVDYASNDAYGTLRIYDVLLEELRKTGIYSLYPEWLPTMEHLFFKTEVPFTKVLYTCERNGVYVDRPYLQNLRGPMWEEHEQLTRSMVRLTGDPNFNPNSNDQLRDWFIKHEGLKPLMMTKGGKSGIKVPSIDKGFLEHYEGESEMARLILRDRKLTKLIGTYIDSADEHLDQNSRIHTKYNQDIARTGRLTSSDPNLQNVPTPEKDKFQLRGAFQAQPGQNTELIVGDYCLAPETRILHSDLTWKRIDEVQVGDELIGFDETLGSAARYKRSTVLGTKLLTRPSYQVTTTRGVVTASAEHMWVVRPARGDRASLRRWVRTDALQPGDRISFFGEPWEEERTVEAGYLAGFFDGEGHCARSGPGKHSGSVGFGQNDGVVLDYVSALLEMRGYKTNRSRNGQGCNTVNVCNGIRLIGSIRPRRLLPKAALLWEGGRTWNKGQPPGYVTEVKELGPRAVVAIETSTRTFIAEGFLSHNCQLEMRLLACATATDTNPQGAREMIQIFLDDKDIHMGNAAMVYGPIIRRTHGWDLTYDFIKESKKIDGQVKAGKLPPEARTDRHILALEKRNHIKVIGFGLNYGMKENKLARTLNVSKQEALDIINAYLGTYPAVSGFYEDAIEETRERGFSFSLLGRRRFHPAIHSRNALDRWSEERKCVNLQIQGTAADAVRLAMIKIHNAGLDKKYGCRMLLQIHDELMFECPKETSKGALAEIREMMEHPFPTDLLVPLTVSIGTGPAWNQAK